MRTSGKDEDESSDVESVDDEEFDDFMDNYFKSGDGEGDEEEVDFASEVKKKTKGKKRKAEEEDDDSEDDDDEEAIDFDGDDDADELIDLDDDAAGHEMDELDAYEGSEDDDFEEFGGKAFKEKLQVRVRQNASYFLNSVFFSNSGQSCFIFHVLNNS